MISLGDALLKLGVDPSDLNKALNDTNKNITQAIDQWKGKFMAAGAAMAAVGAAGLKMVDSAREINASLKQIAITTGNSEASLRDLALATTDVSFPLDSVVKTFDLLSRAGIDNEAQMQKVSNAFDTLADAVGSDAEKMAELLIPAYKAFGKELPTTSAELDKFTWLTKNTTIDLADFGSVMTYLAPEMDKLGVSMDDTVAIMAALEARGISGSAATRAFRTAVTEAVKEDKDLNDVLGITRDEMSKYSVKISQATGLTDKYSEAANTQFGIMDKLKQKLSELTLEVGTSIEPLEGLFAALTSIGTAAIGLSLILPKLGFSLGAISALLTGPVGLVVAVTALGAAWALNFGGMRDTTDTFFNNLKDWARQASPMGTILFGPSDEWERMIGEMGPQTVQMVEGVVGGVKTATDVARGSIVDLSESFNIHIDRMNAAWKGLFERTIPETEDPFKAQNEFVDNFEANIKSAYESLRLAALSPLQLRAVQQGMDISLFDESTRTAEEVFLTTEELIRQGKVYKDMLLGLNEAQAYSVASAVADGVLDISTAYEILAENINRANNKLDKNIEKTKEVIEAAEEVRIYFSHAGEGMDYSSKAYDAAMAEWQRIADMYASPIFKAGGIATPAGMNYMTPQLPLPPGFAATGGIVPPTIYPNVPNGVQVIFQGPVYGMDDFNNKVNAAVRDAKVRGGG